MNTKTTLVLAILAVAVAACLVFIVKPWEEKTAAPEEEPTSTAKALFDPKPTDVDHVEVSVRGEPVKRVFKKDADGWTMLSPTTCPSTDITYDLINKVADAKYLKELSLIHI